MTTTRPSSPAEIREGLDPMQVDALADELHDLSCPRRHRSECQDIDRAKARFLMLGLRKRGWILIREAQAPTQWAYDQACTALDRKTERLNKIRALNRPETRYWVQADGLPTDGAWTIAWDDIQRILEEP